MRAHALLHCLLVLCAWVAASSRIGAQQTDPRTGVAGWDDGGRSDVQFFTVPLTRDAAELAARAMEHIEAERWGEALDDLQRLLTEHPGDLLPHGWDAGERPASLYRVHTGAAHWAMALLTTLPPKARELYAQRYGAYAAPALVAARRAGDRRALVDVAQTWPIAPAARSAWWILGDLELELGHVDEALRCWNRAVELLALEDLPKPPGVERRFSQARELVRDDPEFATFASDSNSTSGVPATSTSAGLYLPGPGQGHGPIPQRDADEPWRYAIPDNPYTREANAHCLYPLLEGDKVLVNTSLQVAAVDAYSGEELWLSEEPAGWRSMGTSRRKEFFEGVDRTNGMVACDAANGVVVAPLQIPYLNLPNSHFQGITIMVTIPERRLFAFDLESGEPLWDHMPPPLWDGLSGPFATRTQISGPPVIAGSRVLVPCYRLQGRIDFHVACYELFTGELLWETGLISGQRELNMFGRHEFEFCAPPVRVEGDRVIALTQLGTVAALDLFTGRILWESLYEQIPLPKNRSWRTQSRLQYWRNSPPVVADGAVVVTPLDSDDLVAFDLETGAQLWSRSHSRFKSARRAGDLDEPNVLLGANHETVFLGGRSIVAAHKLGGLSRAGGAFQVEVLDDLREMPRDPDPLRVPPRPVLGHDEILVPTPEHRIAVSRAGPARRSAPVAWDSRQVGNVLLGSGVLYTLNSRWLSGFYDWHVLLRRAHARLGSDPDDFDAVLNLGDLLGRKGRALHREGNRSAALNVFQEARALLEPKLGLADISGHRRTAESLHHILRGEAAVRAAEADASHALRLLERALPLAHDAATQRDTLLEQEMLLREREPERWLAVMSQLANLSDGLAMPWDRLSAEFSPHPRSDPWLADTFAREVTRDVPVGLWVLVQRATTYAERGATRLELEDLHEILVRYPNEPLGAGRSAYDLAEERIRARLAAGGRNAYEGFEERAEQAFDGAMETRDRGALERLTRRFPHARATERAHRTLLDWAFEVGDTAEVARRAYRALAAEIAPERGDEALWKLAQAAAKDGNRDLASGIARGIADGGSLAAASARDWLEALPELSQPVAPSTRAHFDERLYRIDDLEGKWEVLGAYDLAADGNGAAAADPEDFERVVVIASDRTVVAYTGSDPEIPLWDYRSSEQVTPTIRRSGVAFGAERVVIATDTEIVALDAREGHPLWRQVMLDPLQAMTEADGVTLALTQSARLQAFDTRSGIELWSRSLPATSTTWLPPIHGDGRVVLLTSTYRDPAPALVLDLVRGSVVRQLSLSQPTGPGHGAWIEGGALLLPSFQSSRPGNDLTAIDLDSGRTRWGVELATTEHLHSIARFEDDTYLVVYPNDPAAQQKGALLQLDTRLGATRQVLALEVELVPLGWRARDTAQLTGPWIFFQEDVPGYPDTPIVAIELPYGRRWVYRLPVSHNDLLNRGLPLPALGRNTVGLAYATKGRGPQQSAMYLHLVDLQSGLRKDTRKLSTELGRSTTLEMVPTGDALILAGRHRHGGRVEVWRNRDTEDEER